MNIQKVYVTSKGVFWDKAEAEKKVNRVREYGSRPYDVELEPVRESFVLIADVQTDRGVRGIGTETCVFELSKVNVK
jgi:hypothetical protein